MVKIYVRDGQALENALRLLKKKMQREKVMEGHKKHLHYEKPSDRNRKERFQRYVRARRAQQYIDRH